MAKKINIKHSKINEIKLKKVNLPPYTFHRHIIKPTTAAVLLKVSTRVKPITMYPANVIFLTNRARAKIIKYKPVKLVSPPYKETLVSFPSISGNIIPRKSDITSHVVRGNKL